MNDVEERPTWVDGLAETLIKLADAMVRDVRAGRLLADPGF